MPRISVSCAIAIVLAIGVVLVSSSAAFGTIVFNGGGWSIAMPSWAVPNSGAAVTRDDSNPDVLALEIGKVFRGVLDPATGTMPSIIITFTQISSDALSRIVISDESVSNLTNVSWTGYDMTLMTDGSGDVAFNRGMTFPGDLPGGDPNLNFSTDAFSTHEWMGPSNGNETLRFSQGLVSPLDDFAPGGLSGVLVIDIKTVTVPPGSAGIVFKLKQIARVPEPATLALLGTGAAFVMLRRRRQVN